MKTKAETKQAIRLSLTGLVVTLLFVAVSVFVYGPNNTAHAAINNEINFQGKLTNPNGTNVTDGTYTVIFSLYTVSSGGSNVWTETDSVTTTSGIFQVNLGAVTSLPGSVNFDSSNLYLGIKVGSDPEMTPRIQFTAVPQAFQATNSDNLGGVAAASYAQLTNASQQTFTGSSKFQATTNINSVDILQNSSGSFGQDVFDVQGSSGGTNNFIQVTSTAANQGAVTIASLGSNNLNLNSGSNTISVGATTLQGTGALTIAAASGSGSGSATTINSGNASAGTAGTLTVDTGTSTSGTSQLNIGTVNAGAIAIGKSGATTTVNGALTVAQLLTVNTLGTASSTLACINGSNQLASCTSGSSLYVSFAPSSAQVDSSTNSSIFINKTGASGNILQLQKGGANVLTVGNTGNTTFENSTNSTTAFQIQNATASPLLTADTTNTQVTVGGDINVGTLTNGNSIFTDGFESSSFNLWTSGNPNDGTSSIESSIVHSGNYAMEENLSGSSSGLYQWLAADTTTYFRAWVYVASQTTSTVNLVTLSNGNNGNPTDWLLQRTTSGQVCLDFYTGAGGQHCGGSFTTGTWHEIEAQVTVGGSPVTNLWLDGTNIYNSTSVSNGSTGVEYLDFDQTSGDVVNYYVDDVAITTQRDSTDSSLSISDNLNVQGSASLNGSVLINNEPDGSTHSFEVEGDSGASAFNINTTFQSTTTINTNLTVIEPYANGTTTLEVENYNATNVPLDVDTTHGYVGIGTATPSAELNVTGANLQPTSVSSGNGTAAASALTLIGATGGNTTATGVVNGGAGAGISLTTGTGGTSATTSTGTGGTGGNFSTTLGTGGATTGTSGASTGGTGGSYTLQAGTGGQTAAGNAAGKAGTGGNITIQGGTAAALTNVSQTLGTAGTVTIQGGTGSNGTSTSANGNGGALTLEGGAAGSGGSGTAGTSGSVIVKSNGTNSTTAFQVQDSSANTQLAVDTTNDKVKLGDAENTVTYYTHQAVTPATGTSVTSSAFTVGGTNPVMIVNIALASATATVSSVTWSLGGGTPAQISTVRNGTTYLSVWAIPAPTAGSGTYTVHFSASVAYQVDAQVFDGADQTTPVPSGDAVTTNSGTQAVNYLTLTPSNVGGNDAESAVASLTNTGDVVGLDPNTSDVNDTSTVGLISGYAFGSKVMSGQYVNEGSNMDAAMIGVHIKAAVAVSGNSILVTNSNNDTTALQVNDATGANVINVDTLDHTLTVSAITPTVTEGANLVTNDYSNTGHWTTVNTGSWTLSTGSAAYNSTTTTGSIEADQFTPVAGDVYAYSFTVTGENTNNCVDAELGNAYSDCVFTNGTYSGYLTATNGTLAAINAYQTNGATFTFSNISFELVSGFNDSISAFNIQNSTGTVFSVQSTTESNSMFIGTNAGEEATAGFDNTFDGDNSGQFLNDSFNNTALGYGTLEYGNYSASDVAIGSGALNNGIFSSFDTAVGVASMQNSAGLDNTAVGAWTLQNVNEGVSANNAFGYEALEYDNAGYQNNAFGSQALNDTAGGYSNSAFGDGALSGVTSGYGNTALGASAGDDYNYLNNLTTGNWDTFLGAETGTASGNVATLQNSTAIGAYAEVDKNNALVLGCISGTNSCSTTTDVGIGTTAPDYQLSVIGSNSTGAIASIVNTYSTSNASSTALRIGTGIAATSTTARLITFYAAASADNNGTGAGNIELNNTGHVNYNTAGADYGEYFGIGSQDPALGDIAMVDTSAGNATDATGSNSLLGVVSDDTGFTGNGSTCGDDNTCENQYDQSHVLVGMVGQIPTNVTSENGPIHAGDPITVSSSVPGYGSKLNGAGNIVGYALADFDPANGEGTAETCPAGTAAGVTCGTIEVDVNPTYYTPSSLDLIQNGGDATLGNLDVSGSAYLANLNVSGATTLTSLSVQSATISGSLTVTGLTTVSDIQINGHIITAGNAPTITAYSAAGGGASVSISGDDTTGTITITTGSTNISAGDLAQILFSKTYAQAPHVVLSPSNAAATTLDYFKGATSATDFIFDANAPPAANTTYQFDYFIAQ